MGTEPFISVGKRRNDGSQVTPTGLTKNSARIKMREILATPSGRKAYARRKSTAEPVFGQI